MAILECQSETLGSTCGSLAGDRVVGLRQVNHPRVVTEIHVAQLRCPVETEAAPDQRVEMLGKKIREVERAELFFQKC